MDKHVFLFQDENLNAEKALHGSLKMIAGVDGISMLALGAEKEVLWLESIQTTDKKNDLPGFESEVPEILSDHTLLKYTFGSVRAALSLPLATLVPERLFSPDDCSKYFQLLQPVRPGTLFGYEALKAFGCNLVWGAPPEFQRVINRYQPGHLASALIPEYQQRASREGYSIFLNVRGHSAQITVFDLRSLLFYNTFEFVKPSDLLYVVLLAYDQFRLNPEQVPLYATGALLEDTEHYKMLFRYIQTIEFIQPDALPSLPKGKNTLPPHYWFDLLSL